MKALIWLAVVIGCVYGVNYCVGAVFSSATPLNSVAIHTEGQKTDLQVFDGED